MAVQNIYDMADTWTDASVTYNAILMDVTDTGSFDQSNLLKLALNGNSRFEVTKYGNLIVKPAGTSNYGLELGSTNSVYGSPSIMEIGQYGRGQILFSGGGQMLLFQGVTNYFFSDTRGRPSGSSFTSNPGTNFRLRPATGEFAHENNHIHIVDGVNPQSLSVYNTLTDFSNYERVDFGWDSNVFKIAPKAAGTGSVRELHISGLPTANPGAGILWNDSGTVKVGT